MRVALILLAGASLAACSTNTKGSWSCGGVGEGQTCASIAQIDGSRSSGAANPESPGIENAVPVRWWEPQPFVFSDGTGPRCEGDQILPVVFAPWVDAQGDYHQRSEVWAVMRRGGWWVPAPNAPRPGPSASEIGRNAVQE